MTMNISNFFRVIVLGLIVAFMLQFVIFGATLLNWLTEGTVLLLIPMIGLSLITTHRPLSPTARAIFVAVIVYFVFLGLSTIFYGNRNASRTMWFFIDMLLDAKLFVIVLFGIITARSDRLSSAIRTMCYIFIIFGLFNSIFVFRDIILGGSSIHGVPLERRGAFTIPLGLFLLKVHSAQFSLYLMIAAFALSNANSRYQNLWKAVAWFAFLVVVAHVSVKEIASAIIVLAGYYVLQGKTRPTWRVFSILLTPVLVVAVMSFNNPISSGVSDRIRTFFGERGEQTVRTRSYVGAVQLSNNMFPLGAGAATFMSKGAKDHYSEYYYVTGVSRLYGGSKDNPTFLMDTFWPKIFGQAGYIGGLGYLTAIVILFLLAVRVLSTTRSTESFYASMVMISSAISSLATPIYTRDYVLVCVALAATYLLTRGVKSVETARNSKRRSVSTRGRVQQSRAGRIALS